MSVKYNRLFNFSIEHEYYKDGINEDVVLVPDQNTKQQLTNGKLLFKMLGNNAIVLFKTGNDKISPFINLGTDVNFRFYIKTERRDEFFNITKLDASKKYEAGNKLYFSNNPANASTDISNPEVLTHTLIDKAFGKLFTYSFSLTSAHIKTKFKLFDSDGNLVSAGKDSAGNDLSTVINLIRDDSKMFHQQVDLRNKANGIYTISIKNDADTVLLKEETVLIDNEGISQNVIGIFDIKYDTLSNHMYGATEFYKLQFNRKTAFWKYYVVNKSQTLDLADVATSLDIEDSLTGSGPPYVNVNFTREGDEPHATTKVKGFDTVIFKSSAEIPSFEQPKLNVKLVLKPDDKVMVEHLSNPPFNSVEKENGGDIEKEIFVFI